MRRSLAGTRWVLANEVFDYFKRIERRIRLADVHQDYLEFQAEVTDEELLAHPASAVVRPGLSRRKRIFRLFLTTVHPELEQADWTMVPSPASQEMVALSSLLAEATGLWEMDTMVAVLPGLDELSHWTLDAYQRFHNSHAQTMPIVLEQLSVDLVEVQLPTPWRTLIELLQRADPAPGIPDTWDGLEPWALALLEIMEAEVDDSR
ncbi:MAG: hypothetical protein M1826_000325 [Phylliscum demangeonii]|nr:MAG: hypothetical protein M1826_000325 [Phylliscum demangeonii]